MKKREKELRNDINYHTHPCIKSKRRLNKTNLKDAYYLAMWQYQFSISPEIAEERFNELLGDASKDVQNFADVCLMFYKGGMTWLQSLEHTRLLCKREVNKIE